MTSYYLLRLAVPLLLVVGGCAKKESDAAAPDPNAPILNANDTGWERVVSIPITAAPGINNSNSMTLVDLQLTGSEVLALYSEFTNLAGNLPTSQYKARVPLSGAAVISPLPRLDASTRDVFGGDNYLNSFFFQPGTFDAYRGRISGGTGLGNFGASEVQAESGQRYSTGSFPCLLNSIPGYFYGAPAQLQADGTVLFSRGFTENGHWQYWLAFYQRGRFLRALTQDRGRGTSPLATAFQAVRLPSGRLHGALITEDKVAITDTIRRALPTGNPTLGPIVTATFPNHRAGAGLLAKAFGNSLVFVTWGEAPYRFSAYRWQEGSASIQQLYANVALPETTLPLSPVLTQPFINAQLDANGGLHFFAKLPNAAGAVGTALVRVDASGAQPVSKLLNLKDLYAFSGLRLLNGQWYAGLGLTIDNAVVPGRRLDIVRLRP